VSWFFPLFPLGLERRSFFLSPPSPSCLGQVESSSPPGFLLLVQRKKTNSFPFLLSYHALPPRCPYLYFIIHYTLLGCFYSLSFPRSRRKKRFPSPFFLFPFADSSEDCSPSFPSFSVDASFPPLYTLVKERGEGDDAFASSLFSSI